MSRPTDADADGRRLRRSSSLAGVGDGVLAVALPLLAAGTSRDPLTVAAVIAALHLPWPVLAAARPALVAAGDQRTVLGLGATLRAVAVIVVGLLGLIGTATAPFLVLAALIAGVGAALADEAEETASTGGTRSSGTESAAADLRRRGMVGLAVVGLPLGGLVYELAAALPFLVDVGVYALAALSALSLRRPLRGVTPDDGSAARGRSTAIPALSNGAGPLTLVVAGATAAGSAVLGVLVLFAVDDLGLGAPAFGFLLAGLAAAATLGGLAAPTIGALLGLRGGAGVALATSGAGYGAAGVLADPGRPLAAVVALGVGAAAAMAGGVLLRAMLHTGAARAVEGDALAGFHLRVWAAVPLGALAGGLVAEVAGVPTAVTVAGVTAGAVALSVAALPRRAPGARPPAAEGK